MEGERRGRRRDGDRRILNAFANYWELLPSVGDRNAVKIFIFVTLSGRWLPRWPDSLQLLNSHNGLTHTHKQTMYTLGGRVLATRD